MAEVSTSTTSGILSERAERFDRQLADRELRIFQWAARIGQAALQRHKEVRIEPYAPNLTAPNSWLLVLEARIRESVLPDEYESEPSTEWLSEKAANAAIAFFRTGADLLPTEPHIYATKSGDLVAEFETAKGNMTSVVSDNETILFAVLASDPYDPIQCTIRRGSNQFRDELRSFTEKLNPGSHAQMESND